MQWWRSPTAHDQRDITFVAFGDAHAVDPTPGCEDSGSPDHNRLIASALNSTLPSIFWQPHVWPSGANFYREGELYDHVRALIPVGDLTDTGDESRPAGPQRCREYRAYRDAFGRCGNEGRLNFPVYDVYGNHDFPRQSAPGDVNFHPVIGQLDAISAAHRPGAPADLYDHPTSGTGHYAWRWDDIWFVSVNVKPGYNLEQVGPGADNTVRLIDPHSARGFYKSFLMSLPNSTKRQIVIVAHYPLTSARIDEEERVSLCQRLYNAQHASGDFTGQKLSLTNPVVAYIHGHNHHAPEHNDWTCPSPYSSITIPHFSVGTPLYENDNNNGQLHFTIFRLGTTKLEVVGVGAPASNPTGPWSYVYKERLNILNAP